MAKITENQAKIIDYLKGTEGANVTANDIADAIGLTPRQVTGTLTSMGKRGWIERVPAEIELDDGTHKATKFVVLTEDGKNFDPEAVDDEE